MLIGLQRIAAYQFSQPVGLVCGCGADGTHFPENDGKSGLGNLPGSFTTCESAARDMNRMFQPSIIARNSTLSVPVRFRAMDDFFQKPATFSQVVASKQYPSRTLEFEKILRTHRLLKAY